VGVCDNTEQRSPYVIQQPHQLGLTFREGAEDGSV
jgi:hypothetical protein